MFLLLSRVLLWLLVGTIVYSLFQRFYPSGTFAGRLIVVILLLVLALSFVNPNEPAVASLWRVVSFPLKPLGASMLMMMFAAQRIKGGGVDKPGGYLLGWALTILILASTPAVAYFLVRSPVAMVGSPSIASQIENYRLASTSGTLVALGESPSAIVSDVPVSPILPAMNMTAATVAFNNVEVIPPYLLQTPTDITRRGLRLEDFVPNAETLSLTTRVWESYLNQTYFFLRGR
ncbi:hypothetical protein NIES4075_15650 [Tolypothrix sp. NIES-4075]|uniref:hypothetical protein n=1 Tax=Tolypothrix sp. NIES-4075 TaxID=2005459 RepID=UPI000B5C63AA|nr:hypothetical protein [Tolypothrix sp. NIES-4075]GAX40599.1 hypothetical protein NIES4075_15650 [Tolypothrix sp. NIES-4075]